MYNNMILSLIILNNLTLKCFYTVDTDILTAHVQKEAGKSRYFKYAMFKSEVCSLYHMLNTFYLAFLM